MPRETVIV